MERGLRRTKKGFVISDKMDKTISVKCEKLVKHPQYGKYIKRSTVFKAHDDKNEAGVGDEVEIMETKPLSKTKRWRLIKIVKKAELMAE